MIEQQAKIKKWLRIIALWALVGSLFGICFYILIQLHIIDESLNRFEIFDLFFDIAAGLIIFIGLWCFKPWGWKATVLLIPFSWIISCYGLITDYFRGLGIFISPFIILDATILRYLFKPEVMNSCQIFSTHLLNLKWSSNGLFLLTLYLIANDIFGDLIGIITVLAIFLGIMTAKKYVRKLKTVKDITPS